VYDYIIYIYIKILAFQHDEDFSLEHIFYYVHLLFDILTKNVHRVSNMLSAVLCLSKTLARDLTSPSWTYTCCRYTNRESQAEV